MPDTAADGVETVAEKLSGPKYGFELKTAQVKA